ncbi:MAG: D-alanyl-D-alanine carboxypeptidase family protein [Candidatus Puniceispirillaceae bacterium]
MNFRTILTIYLGIFWLCSATAVQAQNISTSAKYALITDFDSGLVILDKDADAPMKPASMAKIMTIYIAFGRIAEGSLSLDDSFVISEKAWKMGGSRSFLNAGAQYSLSELLHGIIIQSGNDAAVALAEGISGSEENFANEMNVVAARLGMKNTIFKNSTGWPHPEITTTARDLNILATALIRDFPVSEYPQLYPIFAKITYTLNEIKQGNRNPLLYGKNADRNGADGLKTGYTEESGYGLTASALRNGQRVVMVLNGMSSKSERANESRRLMDFVFREYRKYEFFDAGETIDEANIWLGEQAKLPLILGEPLHRVMSRVDRAKTSFQVTWQDPVPAPITKGQQVGVLSLTRDDKVVETIPLLAGNSVSELGLLDRVGAALKYIILGASNTSAGSTSGS